LFEISVVSEKRIIALLVHRDLIVETLVLLFDQRNLLIESSDSVRVTCDFSLLISNDRSHVVNVSFFQSELLLELFKLRDGSSHLRAKIDDLFFPSFVLIFRSHKLLLQFLISSLFCGKSYVMIGLERFYL